MQLTVNKTVDYTRGTRLTISRLVVRGSIKGTTRPLNNLCSCPHTTLDTFFHSDSLDQLSQKT